MSDYSFKPNFKAWWKDTTATHEDFSWVTLGINPTTLKRSKEINAKTSEITPEEMRFRGQLDDYILNLHRGMLIRYTHAALMKLDWGQGKEFFIKQAYEHNFEIHPDFCDYLRSEDKMPLNPTLESYKNHEQYKANLGEWKLEDINDEDTALSLLLGLTPAFFLEFLSLHFNMKEENRTADGLSAYYGFKPEGKWLFDEYSSFLKEEFPRLAVDINWPIMHIIPSYKAAKELTQWTGSFLTYVQSLHDNGFIFMPKTYAALKKHGIELSYSPDSWAMQFYQRFLRQGVWNLKDAASIYRGSDPHGRREFVSFANTALHGSGAGFALETSETIVEFDDNDTFVPPPEQSLAEIMETEENPFEDSTSLEGFVRRHLKAESLVEGKKFEAIEENGGLYFKPVMIVKFFRDYLPRTYRPKALYQELGLDEKVGKKKAEPISVAALKKEYKKYVNDNKSRGITPSWKEDQQAMEEALGKKPTDAQIKQIRDEMAPDHWKQRGRRKRAGN